MALFILCITKNLTYYFILAPEWPDHIIRMEFQNLIVNGDYAVPFSFLDNKNIIRHTASNNNCTICYNLYNLPNIKGNY